MKIYLGLIALFAGEKELENWTPCDGRTLNGNMILSAALQILTGESMGMNPTLPNLPDVGKVKHYMCTSNAPLAPGEDIEDIIGFVKELEGNTVPDNWLLCDGRHFDKAGTDYVLLLNVICNKYEGYAYTPYFALPNLNTGSKRYIICSNGTFPYS